MKLRFEKDHDAIAADMWKYRLRGVGQAEVISRPSCKTLPGAKRSARAFLWNMSDCLNPYYHIGPGIINAIIEKAEVVE